MLGIPPPEHCDSAAEIPDSGGRIHFAALVIPIHVGFPYSFFQDPY
ncbi:hypothetical protein BBKW_0572 [Bifidobacterium catenulatum subsp. kashiwanohense JCM 15439 = DSM 21854]|nr:hypothetical protein BBKW_0572 [Bifidobacterium catenulatum subsp. kashiwanohense JCM 15439 = DSM 21854]